MVVQLVHPGSLTLCAKKAEFFFIENLNFLYFNGDEVASQIFDDGNTLDAKDPRTISMCLSSFLHWKVCMR